MYELQRRNTTFSKLKELLKTKCCKLTANREILPASPPLNKIKWYSFVLPSLSRAYLMVL